MRSNGYARRRNKTKMPAATSRITPTPAAQPSQPGPLASADAGTAAGAAAGGAVVGTVAGGADEAGVVADASATVNL
jgi:hypothetical protein